MARTKKETPETGGEKKKRAPRRTTSSKTFDGHPLTPHEEKFIAEYVITGNARQSYITAYPNGNPNNAHQNAYRLLQKEYIVSEINHRLQLAKEESVATATEIMNYFTAVMRGEIKDQFGLEASLSERTKAAVELAKRQIDMPQRLSGNEPPQIKIVLDWARPETEEPEDMDGEKTIILENE